MKAKICAVFFVDWKEESDPLCIAVRECVARSDYGKPRTKNGKPVDYRATVKFSTALSAWAFQVKREGYVFASGERSSLAKAKRACEKEAQRALKYRDEFVSHVDAPPCP